MNPRSWSRAAVAALALTWLALTGFATPTLAASARLDRTPVSAAEYEALALKKGERPANRPLTPKGGPAVNIDWHQASAYCKAGGKRLPSAQEWIAACEARELDFPWWTWEWTSTDAKGGEAGFKLLCGPGADTCACTHAYHPTWSNEVKGFRCARPQPSVMLRDRVVAP